MSTSHFINLRVNEAGRLTLALVRRAVMGAAIARLVDGVSSYSIFVSRSRFDAVTGNEREREVVITEKDGALTVDRLDPRLVDAREIVIVFATDERHIATVDVGRRKWSVMFKNEELRKRVDTFNADLKGKALPLWTIPDIWFRGLLLAFLAVLALVWIADLSSPKFTFTDPPPAGQSTDFAVMPAWAKYCLAGLAVLLLVFLVGGVAAAMGKMFLAGPLGVVPDGLHWGTVLRMTHEFRARSVNAATFDKLAWVAVTVVVTLVATKIFSFLA